MSAHLGRVLASGGVMLGVFGLSAMLGASPAGPGTYEASEVTSTNKKVCRTLVGEAHRLAISVSACTCIKAALPLPREYVWHFLLACDLINEHFAVT